MNALTVPVRDLMVVAPFVAEGDVRYYLNGISCEPLPEGGAILVGTNGHILAAYRSHDAQVESKCILGWPDKLKQECARALRARGARKPRVEVATATDHARVVDTTELHIQTGRGLIDGRYPEWRKIVKNDLVPGLPGSYNREYLDKIIRVKYPSSIENYSGVQFFYSKSTLKPDESTIVARFPSLPDLLIVLMPMRFGSVSPLPEWMQSEAAPEQAAA